MDNDTYCATFGLQRQVNWCNGEPYKEGFFEKAAGPWKKKK